MIGTTIRECFKFQICSEFKSLGAWKCGELTEKRSDERTTFDFSNTF